MVSEDEARTSCCGQRTGILTWMLRIALFDHTPSYERLAHDAGKSEKQEAGAHFAWIFPKKHYTYQGLSAQPLALLSCTPLDTPPVWRVRRGITGRCVCAFTFSPKCGFIYVRKQVGAFASRRGPSILLIPYETMTAGARTTSVGSHKAVQRQQN